jgi:hypothetical protein
MITSNSIYAAHTLILPLSSVDNNNYCNNNGHEHHTNLDNDRINDNNDVMRHINN